MSHKLEFIMDSAIKKAIALCHEYITLEQILCALLKDDVILEILVNCGASPDNIRNQLNEFLKDESNFSILSDGQIESLRSVQFKDEEILKAADASGLRYQPQISLALQRVIQRAAVMIHSSGKRAIRSENILVAIFHEKESYARYILEQNGVDRFKVIKEISARNRKQENLDRNLSYTNDKVNTDNNSYSTKRSVDLYTTNLSKLSMEGMLDPLVGCQEYLIRITQVLCRRYKNNPLLVGDPGVGKTAIVRGFTNFINSKSCPHTLKNATVYELDMMSLLAGTKFRGDFEQRIEAVINDLKQDAKNGKKPILFIDEIHVVMGAGSTGHGSMDLSNCLKSSLIAGNIRFLGSTTFEEYKKFIDRDYAFSRRFQKIDIDEPSKEDTLKILLGLRSKFEDFHGVKYSTPVLKLVVELTDKYISDRKNPDKSIDIVDEVGSYMQISKESKNRIKVSKSDIEKMVAKAAKVPRVTVVQSERESLSGLKSSLERTLFGQPEAVEKVTDAILLSRSGLSVQDRPQASFLFAGPTGVGKTELARQLSFYLGCHLQRFDMSEYMEKHAVSKLIGAPPGYVGHEDGGRLTDSIKKHPHCVLLLDELEKAHSDIYNVLLQVMDYGKLTDSQGRTTDFRNCIIIMTTNAGSGEMEAGSISLGKKEINSSKKDRAIKQFFPPEFRNRLDAVIHFNPLTHQEMIKIVEKFIGILENQLLEHNISLEIDESAINWLAREGFDGKMGARPLSRLIDQIVKKPLSKELLFGNLGKGGKVFINLSKAKKTGKNNLKLQFS